MRLLPDSLEEQFAGLQALMRDSPAWVWAKDDGLRYIFISHAMEVALGVPDWLWVNKTDADLFPPRLAADMRATDLATLRGHVPFTFSREHECDAGPRLMHVLKFPLRLGEGRMGVGGMAIDVTDRESHPCPFHTGRIPYRLAS